MTLKFRRLSRAAACCALLVFSSTSLVSSTPTERPCDALRRWAAPYRGTSPTLDDLARFDRGHRIAIFNVIPAETRAALWREQLTRFARSSQLTDVQRALVREAITLTTPGLYAGDRRAAEALRTFWTTRAGAAFGREHRAAWLTLGSVVSAAAPTSAAATGENWCGCSGAWAWFDCESMSCPSAPCDEWLGCGLNWSAVCDGFCTPVAQ
jgi:hypothetical protein